MTNEDRLQEVWAWNAAVPETIHRCVHDLISERVRSQPDAQAIEAHDGTLTYGELDSLSTRLARRLAPAIRKDTVVPLCFAKSSWTVVAILSVLKAGGAFVLLDISQPEARLRSIVEQTQSPIICSSAEARELSSRLVGEQCDIVTVGPAAFNTSEAADGDEGDLPASSPSSICYVVFTSGSTGVPKGAVVSHSNICSAFHYQLDQLGFSAKSRTFDFASYAFDVAVHNVLATLAVGGSLCIPNEVDRLQDPALAMATMEVTVANLTPSFAPLIDPERVPTLRTLIFLGETLGRYEVQRWWQKVDVINTYGPAECTPISTINSRMEDPSVVSNVSIGVGVGVVSWVVDPDNHELLSEPGQVGELCLEGPIVGMGYLNDPERTAEAFITDPPWLSRRRSSRLYKTGDLVSQSKETGSLRFVGRKDTQVKYHGQRIELGEVEHHVQASFSNVLQIAVEIVGPKTNPSLAAFIQFSSGAHSSRNSASIDSSDRSLITPDATTTEEIARRLPEYMIPAVYYSLSTLPRTASGKIDRKRLRELGSMPRSRQTQVESRRPPTTEMERKLQVLWATVLGLDPETLSLDDSFLGSGGDSLAAIRLVGEARQANIQLRVAGIFRRPTLEDQARAAIWAPQIQPVVPFSLCKDPTIVAEIANLCDTATADIEDVYPCTPLQEGLFILTTQQPLDYVCQVVLPISDLRLETVQAAWEQTYQTTPTLRTRIVQVESGLLQAVLKERLTWYSAKTLDECKRCVPPIELGRPLSRFTLIGEDSGKPEWMALTLHHSLYDAWSLDLVVAEARSCYLGESQRLLLSQPTPNFNTFVKHIEELRERPEMDAYWVAALEDAQSIQFPAVRTMQLPQAANEILDRSCKLPPGPVGTPVATLSTSIRAALAILLSHHTESEDVTFGATVSGRNAPVSGIEKIVGPTLATVPVRVRLDNPAMTFSQFLRAVQDQANDMIGFEQAGLQRISKLGEGPRRACDFQTLLVVQPGDSDSKDEVFSNWRAENEQLSTYALLLECTLLPNEIRMKASFRPTAVDSWRLERMLGQLEYILVQLIESRNSDMSLIDIDIMPERDKALLSTWNAESPINIERCVHQLFQDQVHALPASHQAICSWDGNLTYRELDSWSDRLASYLIALGIGSEMLVPICFERCLLPVVVMLGVLKSGGAFVPIDPSLPEARRQQLLHGSDAKVILTSKAYSALFTNTSCKVISLSLDFLRELPDSEGSANHHQDPSSIAYVLFTSGSTGQPKGVVLEHRAVSSSCTAHGRVLDFHSTSRVLQFSSYVFDACILEIITTLIYGGCICISTEDDKMSNLTGIINTLNINWMCVTSSVSRLLDPASIPNVKTFVLGGEKVNIADAEPWVQAGCHVFSGYGPTECCVFTSLHDFNDGIDSGLIGKAVGSLAWLVDPNDHNRLAPVGGIGEYLVEGNSLARGYLNDEAKTTASFIVDPEWSLQDKTGNTARPSRRFYKTGDLVQYTSTAGTLKYLGRKDLQTKVRGQRLELAEVEHHVKHCIPGAQQVVADTISVDANKGTDILVAFIQSRQDPRVDHEAVESDRPALLLSITPDVNQAIAERLPRYMVPTVFISMPRGIPRMAQSGKTDRRQLREIALSIYGQHLAEIEATSVDKRQPTSQAEYKLQNIWARVLNIQNEASIGLDDTWLERGGDSILAMKLVAEARKEHIALTFADILRAPTVAAQAKLQHSAALAPSSAITPFSLLSQSVDVQELGDDLAFTYRNEMGSAEIEDMYPCTPLQEGIISLASKHPGDYVLQNVLELPDDLRLPEFMMAWETVVKSTPTLRTRIVQHRELGLIQLVLHLDMAWTRSEDDLDDYLNRDKTAVMGLGQPLSRFALLGKAGEPRYFVWTAHHALYDGWSLPLVTDLANHLYLENCSRAKQEPDALVRQPLTQSQQSFSAFVGYVENQKGDHADRYWRTAFQDLEAGPFPVLPSNVREPKADMILEHCCSISARHPNQRSMATTTSTYIRAALALLISRHTSSPDVVFGITLSGRNAPVARITDIIGPTISTVPLRIHAGTEDGRTAMSFLRDVARQDIEYEQMGLQHIAKLSKDCQSACQFQTLLVIQPEDDDKPIEQAFGTWRTGQQAGFTTYAVTLECFPTLHGVKFRARFDTRVIDTWKMERFLCQLGHVVGQLELVATGADRPLADIDVLAPQDRNILQQWNGAPPKPAVERCLHKMIHEQARARESKTAIVGWDGEFTYGALDALSDRLAQHLVDLGVGPEMFVPLCFPKSTWTPVAMLSVLKAGGAFVLLDPNHPEQRLRTLCQKVGATVAVAASDTAERIHAFVDKVVIFDKHAADLLPHPKSTSEMRGSPSNTAYIIFTSGSTGVPKGAKLQHRSFASAAINHAWIMGMSPGTRAFQFGSYIFAGALLEILLTLIYGGCVCVPSDEERLSQLDQAINRFQPNWAFFTPSVLSSLSPEMVPSLKTVCIGGEAIYHSQIAQWSDHLHLRQTYGSAETGAVISSAHLTQQASTSDVGRPTAGRYWIVDPLNVNKLAPLGSAGEVIIEGPSIAREYLDEPEKSAAAFIQVPAWRHLFGAPEAGSRFYRTGDLAIYTAEGAIRLLGRKDSQIKLRGQRIELGEIEEQARSATKEVAELAVELAVPRDSDLKAAMLVAYVVLRQATEQDGEPPDERSRKILSGLREKLQSVLPQHMVPSVFIALPELPKTISKKIDRKTLRAMASSHSRQELVTLGSIGDGHKRQPTTNRETRLRDIWSKILNVEAQEIGLDDDWFAIGGDSVSALKLVSEARRAGFALKMADIFKDRTLAAQALTAPAGSADDAIPSFSLLGPDSNTEALRGEFAASCGTDVSAVEDAYPCTPLQEGLLSLTLKNTGDYVLQSVIELSSNVDLEKFKRAWEQTVSAVATLRTRVVQHSRLGNLQVVIKESITWRQSTDDLGAFLAQDKLQPMDFGQPLSRFTLVGNPATGPCRFVWTAHHALYDGWSLPLLFGLVKDAYFHETVPSQKKFSPFIKYMQGCDSEEAEAFWKSHLQGFDSPSFPALPSSMYKPTADRATERLFNVASGRRSEATLSTLLRASLGLVLGQHSGSPDVVFGAVVSGRNAPVDGVERIVGPLIATVPIRVRLPSDLSVSEYLTSVQRQNSDMIKYEQTGIQNISQINKAACNFQTLLVVQPARQGKAQEDESFGRWLTDPEQAGFTTYALTLQCSLPLHAEGIHVKATFDSTVISPWHMEKLLDQFTWVLQQLADASPEQAISQVEFLTPADRDALWDLHPTVPESVNRCIHDLIDEQTVLHPETVALSSWDGEITYRELGSLSDTLAHHMIYIGAKQGELVPLCFEKSIWTSVAAVAAMKAGLGSLTVDTTQPAERLRAIVQQINAPFALCSRSQEKLASEILPGKPLIVVGRAQLDQIHSHNDAQLPAVSPSSIVCIMSTSGSTGVPKTIAMSHENFATGGLYHNAVFGHEHGARVFAFASYSFDISWFDRIHALSTGATLCIPSEAERKDDLEGSIVRCQATTMFLTPSVARLIRPEAVPSVRVLILGGEPQRWSDFSLWPETMSRISIYGPAECTVVSSASDARILEKRDMTLPADLGLNTWLVDPATERLSPIGAVGEIWLEGPLVGIGYLGDQKRSAASFVEDPAWLLQGSSPRHLGRRGRTYKTGDLARYMPDGSMVFAGRKDNQVKLRGQRVELGEIEHHIRRVMKGQAKHVVAEVIYLSGEKAGAMLVAFLEIPDAMHRGRGQMDSRSSSTADHEVEVLAVGSEVMEELSKLLPSFMVPRVFFAIQSTPRTANGKTDRARLRRMGSQFSTQQLADREASQLEKQQPTNIIESRLRELWAQLLNIKPSSIGTNDNLFSLGADSITAMKLVGEARKRGMSGLTVASIFKLPTLQAQAQLHLQSTGDGDLDHDSKPTLPFSLIDPGISRSALCEDLAKTYGINSAIEDVYPCTPLQEGLLSLTMKHTGDYVLQSVLELAGPTVFRLDAFQAAWQETVLSTDVLRTRIAQHNELGLVQVVLEREGIPWNLVQGQTLQDYLHVNKAVPMELGQPLTRFAIVVDEHDVPRHFVWTLHHALYDGWSLPIIIERATDAYVRLTSALHDRQKILPRDPPKFKSFVRYIKSRKDEDSDIYWKTALAENQSVPFPALPASVTQPMSDRTIEQKCKLSSDVHRRANTTSSTLVRAALALLISRQTYSDDAVFGAIVSGRNAPVAGIEEITGPTIAALPLRMKVNAEERVSDYLLGVQRQAISMIPHEQTGLQRISKLSDDARNACSFQTLLVVQPPGGSPDHEDEVKIEEYGVWRTRSDQQGFTTFALTIECFSSEDGINFRAMFDSRILAPWRVERLLTQLSFLVEQLSSASASTKVAEIGSVPPEDTEMIWNWNAIVPKALDRCVHDMILQKAHEHPNAIAICAWDGELTYRQLDDYSAWLAHNLVGEGVSSGAIVPLCFEKSLWTTVALLAVLRAGAAFVFLDADTQPEARLRSIVEQADATVICSSVARQDLSRRLAKKVLIVGASTVLDRQPDTSRTLPVVDASSPLYLVFTSGSTGNPKGALLSHKSFASALHHQLPSLSIDRSTRLYDFASYSFDVAVHNVLATLCQGACLCVPSDADRKSRPAESMEALKANYANLTSSVARLLDPAEVPTLVTLMLGGEPVTLDDAQKWWGHVKLINSCGPAECTPLSVINDSATDPSAFRSIGFGRGNLTWIVDPADHNRLVPVGQTGEMVLEGPLVGEGYLNDPEKTGAAFIEDPMWLVAGTPSRPGRRGRVYKSGDLVRYNEDGSLQIDGRKDLQVKVRGQRVELEEVDHYLRQCLPTAEVVAETVAINTNASSAILVAFMCSNASSGEHKAGPDARTTAIVDEEATRGISSIAIRLANELSKHLPPYMVPSLYVPVVAMPMTATAKVNRRQLRALVASLSKDQVNAMRGLEADESLSAPPETKLGLQLQTLWARVLGIPASSIGKDQSFFALGGDSILAMRVVGKARKLGIGLTVAEMFRQKTIASLVEEGQLNGKHVETFEAVTPKPFSLIDPATRKGVVSSLKTQPADNVEDILPLTDFQAQCVMNGVTHPRAAYNYFWLDLGAKGVDYDRLRRSCLSLLEHYDILRSIFVPFRDAYWQVVLRDFNLPVPLLPVSVRGDLDLACDEVCSELSREDIKPEDVPTSFTLLQNEQEDCRLVLRLSHAQYDGVCLTPIFQSLANLYHGRPPSTGSAFSIYLAHQLNQRANAITYWKGRLSGAPETAVRPRLSRGIATEAPATKIIRESSVRLPHLSGDISVAALASAAWAILTSVITDQDDVVFGHVVAGREAALHGIEEIVGPCVNIIPVRVKLASTHPTGNSLVRSVQEQFLSLERAGLMMGWKDILQTCTEWDAPFALDSIVQHQNIDEHPELQIAETPARLQWYENPDALPEALGIISYPEGANLRVEIRATSHMISLETADLLVRSMCETVSMLASCAEGCIPGHFLERMRVSLHSCRPLQVNGHA